MLKKKLSDIAGLIAGDLTHLKEVLHPRDFRTSPTNDHLKLGFSLAHAFLKKGEASLPHQLAHSETYFFLQGKGEIFVDEKISEVEKDDLVVVPPHANQHVKNTGEEDLVFLCIVSPPWTPECEVIGERQ